jgi:Lar family restriction alleviation protein
MKITIEVDDTKLKPCPFCGGEAYIRETDIKGTAFVAVSAECKKCGAKPFATMIFEGESGARKKAVAAKDWNRRADDDRE